MLTRISDLMRSSDCKISQVLDRFYAVRGIAGQDPVAGRYAFIGGDVEFHDNLFLVTLLISAVAQRDQIARIVIAFKIKRSGVPEHSLGSIPK